MSTPEAPKYWSYRVARWLSLRLPPLAAFSLAESLADLRWRWAAQDRAAVQANLSIVLGAAPRAYAAVVREVFRNFGRYLVEFFSIDRTAAPQVRLEGYDHLLGAWRKGGVIILTAHIGNWEVGAVILRRMGFPVTAVALPHDDPRMDRLFNAQRTRCGLSVIPLGRHAAQRSLVCLRQGQLLGLLADREFAGDGLVVTLNGHRIRWPRGPALLSLRSRSPVVPTFLLREGRWKFRLCFEPPIWPDRRSLGGDPLLTLTQAYADTVARYLQRCPDQWLIFRPLPNLASLTDTA